MKSQGFTLLETLIALAVSSILMVGAMRTLPQLQSQNLRLMLRAQLYEELQQMMHTLEKAVRRAGYCHGRCQGIGMQAYGLPAVACWCAGMKTAMVSGRPQGMKTVRCGATGCGHPVWRHSVVSRTVRGVAGSD